MRRRASKLTKGWTVSWLLGLLTLGFTVGCAQMEEEPTQGRVATETAAIEFESGQAFLTQDAREQLRELVQDFRSDGSIDEVTVAVWSDQEFPQEGQELTESQKELAENRVENIEEYLEEQLDVDEVQVYNMAERPNWWQSTFNTSEAELKSDFARKGAEQVQDPAFKAFHEEGEASKAVIFLEGRKFD